MKTPTQDTGPIAWMAHNSVAANLLMIILLVGGFMICTQVRIEIFPEFELDRVTISVPYPGASPAEVEQGILLSIEENVRGVDGVKRIEATATEGSASVVVELMTGADSKKALQDIKNEVDRITSFPQDAERPIVSLLVRRHEVTSIVLYGDQDEYIIRQLAERVREEILQNPNITYVEMQGVRPLEIGVEVPQENLRAYNLTLNGIAQEISKTAVEIPAGGVKTDGGEILLRTAERRDFGSQFEDIPVISSKDGTEVRLRDIGTIIDGFRDTDQAGYYNGMPAARVSVYRTGDQSPIEIAQITKDYIENLRPTLPPGVGVAMWEDQSELLSDRISLLLRNMSMGLALVLITLGLFLEIRLAFWVMMGVPISILGSFLLFPTFDVSINMLSLFAFIVTLGIVVDDAIVVGENIYELRQRGYSYIQAAIQGARQVAVPVTFSILTNIATFVPLMFVTGIMGKFFRVIPIIVISVFTISLIESLYVLPAHLGHQHPPKDHGLFAFLFRRQQQVSRGLSWFVHTCYAPFLRLALRNRYLTIAAGVAVLILMLGVVVGGHINFTFFPRVDGDVVTANAVLPFGAPVAETKKVEERLLETAREVLAENGGDNILRGIMALVGNNAGRRGPGPSGGGTGSHLCSVQVYMVPSGERSISATQFAKIWREKTGEMAGLESLTFLFSSGFSAGSPIDVELSHPDIDVLETAAAELANTLQSFTGVKDIDDGFTLGKPQFDLKLKPAARSLGITASDLAQQVRSAFYGARAFRQQRGREEIWVMVRLPESERTSEYNIEELLIRTPSGGEIPLGEAAEVIRGRAYTEINRTDGRRVVNVTGDVETEVTNAEKVLTDLEANVLPDLLSRYPSLGYSLEGESRERDESLESLWRGFMIAMLAIFAMLAIPFGSYVQPLVVMTAIPFGFVGAVLGHIIMGYDLSIISMFGIVALSGVVVNDSLILVHTANQDRDKTGDPFKAVCDGGNPAVPANSLDFLHHILWTGADDL